VTPQLILGAGVVVLVAGFGLLRSFGPRYRVGRLLASATQVPIGEAIRLARAGERRLVRIDGRIDSDEDFEDFDHRPLVLRRTRFESRPAGPAGRWSTFHLQTEAVPFQLNEGLDSIRIDRAALGDGLVVVPRQSVGLVNELGDRAPVDRPDIRPDAAARVTVEQVSSVEHAIVVGVPAVGPDGELEMTAGLGRPLVLTTLELPEAMRILTGGNRLRSTLAAGALVVGAALVVLGLAWWLVGGVVNPSAVSAASPLPSILPGSDTRSSGQGPGIVGDPAFAILGVLGIAIVAVIATLLYVRLTGPRKDAPPKS
jgi:hypothetical protein